MNDSLFEIIIGNIPGARNPNDPSTEWGIVTATVTIAQARERGNSKRLKYRRCRQKWL